MHYTAIHRLASGRGWRLSYEDVRGLIRGLAGHLSKGLHRPLELSYFCIMESSAKRACRVYERVYVCARASTRICIYVHAWKHRDARLDVSRVAENNATCRKTRLRPRRDFIRKIIRCANFPRGFRSGKKVTTVYREARFILCAQAPAARRGRSIEDVIKIGLVGKLLSIGRQTCESARALV